MKKRLLAMALVIISVIVCTPLRTAAQEGAEVLYTEEELAYIELQEKIVIGNFPSRAPMSSLDEDTGEVVGINEEIIKQIQEISGLDIEQTAIPVGERPLDYLKSGAVDLVAGIARTQRALEDDEILISEPFMSANVVPIVSGGATYEPADNLRIAIPSSYQALDEYIKEYYPQYEIYYFDTNDKCLQAVSDGSVDVTMQNEYLVTYLLQNPHYSRLDLVRAYFFQEQNAIASRSDSNPLLISIINKSIAAIEEDTINQIIVTGTASCRYEYTLSDTIYANRMPIAYGMVIIVLGLSLIVVVSIMRSRNEKLLWDKNAELENMVCQLEIAKQEAEEAMHEAEKANKAKSMFLSRMSHEIRTPMNAIIGLTSITSRLVKENPVAADNLGKISFASNTLLNIINDVLDMSAIESEKLKLGNAPFDFKQLVTSVGAMYYQLCKQKNIRFDLYLSGVTEEALIGDEMRLNQILNNLLSNALKFTAEGGNVKLVVSQKKLESSKVYMQFDVQDTGCGMSEDMKKRLFLPFEQETSKTAQEHGGSGLGLSITKNLVGMMMGAIEVSSEKGKGSTFTVSIPFTRTDIQPKRADRNEKLANINCLVVDEDPNTRNYALTVLERIGVRCESASSGEEALGKLQKAFDEKQAFQVCFVDWKLPMIEGKPFIQKIREVYAEDELTIIVSAYDLNEVQDAATEHGANMFLPKPLFQSTIFDVLMNLLEGSYVESEIVSKEYDFSGHHVLLADDTEFNLDVAVELLGIAGLEVSCAKNGQEAVNKFVNHEPGTYDLILMDIQMPVLNGHDATRAIRALERADAKTIPILAMTANAFTEDITESFAAGMNDHLTKPIDADVLYKTLDKYLKENKKEC